MRAMENMIHELRWRLRHHNRYPEKERPAIVNLLQAQIQSAIIVGLLFGHAPAQVDVDQMNAIFLQPLAQRRKHNFDKVIPLRVHIAERGGDEDANDLPGNSHDDTHDIDGHTDSTARVGLVKRTGRQASQRGRLKL